MAQGKRGENKTGKITAWSTKQEISYLDKIGRFKDGAPAETPPPRRLKLLNNYRKALVSRSKWNGVDKDKLLTYLDFEINILLVSGVML